MATLLLAEAGAEVIKIERPGIGDEMRHYPPLVNGESAMFAMLNRGKRSIALDLKSPEDQARLKPLLASADILVEQFRPGVMARMGLDFETLHSDFPRLIYCSITGFGQNGPKAQVAGHDLNYIAQTGLLSLSMGPPEHPVVPPALIADLAGGAYPAMMNILLALEARRKTGRGAHLDISMSDNMFPLSWWAQAQHAATGRTAGNADHLLSGGTARYQIYQTGDGQFIAAAPIEQRFWDRFCQVIELADTYRDDHRDPMATLAAVRRIMAGKTAAEWAAIFDGVDCCCTPVATLDQALQDPHFQQRGLFAHQVAMPGGESLAALHVPIADSFRGDPEIAVAAPGLEQTD